MKINIELSSLFRAHDTYKIIAEELHNREIKLFLKHLFVNKNSCEFEMASRASEHRRALASGLGEYSITDGLGTCQLIDGFCLNRHRVLGKRSCA